MSPFFLPWYITLYWCLQSQRHVFLNPVDGAVLLHPLAIWENKVNTTCSHPKWRDPEKRKLAGIEYLQSGWIISKRRGRTGVGFLLPGENREMACIKTYSSSRRATLRSEWWNLSIGSSSSGWKPAARQKNGITSQVQPTTSKRSFLFPDSSEGSNTMGILKVFNSVVNVCAFCFFEGCIPAVGAFTLYVWKEPITPVWQCYHQGWSGISQTQVHFDTSQRADFLEVVRLSVHSLQRGKWGTVTKKKTFQEFLEKTFIAKWTFQVC